MSLPLQLHRALAGVVIGLAAKALPPAKRAWASAMCAELDYIDNNREAVGWALGCLRSGILERIRSGTLLDFRIVRWGIALWILYRAEDKLCDSLLVLSYKIPTLGLNRVLGPCAAGEEYQRLIPLLESTTFWEVALCLSGAACYLVASGALLWRSRYTRRCIFSALTIEIGLWLYELGKPLYVQAFSFVDLAQDALLYAVTLLLGCVVWYWTQRNPSPQ